MWAMLNRGSESGAPFNQRELRVEKLLWKRIYDMMELMQKERERSINVWYLMVDKVFWLQ